MKNMKRKKKTPRAQMMQDVIVAHRNPPRLFKTYIESKYNKNS